jgi:hypothetical protein
MLLAHTQDYSVLRTPTAQAPWRVLISGCMAGWGCGVDGTDYGMGGHRPLLFESPLAVALPFCPEDVGLGVAAAMLHEAGVVIVAQRDHRTLGRLRQILAPEAAIDPEALDHHQHPWTRAHFGV